MAIYLAMRIEDGYLDYNIIYMKNYRRFKETVDEILTLDGKQDLIKPDPNEIKEWILKSVDTL